MSIEACPVQLHFKGKLTSCSDKCRLFDSQVATEVLEEVKRIKSDGGELNSTTRTKLTTLMNNCLTAFNK